MNRMTTDDGQLILVTGATGYIGGRPLRELERGDYAVRCLARRPEYLPPRASSSTEVVKGDVFDLDSLRSAMKGAHAAYYFVHTLAAKGSFEENDRIAANTFAKAAREAKLQKIIYLGGLGEGQDPSRHLSSRQEVGAILRNSGVPTIEFRASVIFGSGSLSFVMVRAFVQKLALLFTTRWVHVLAQPIAIEDVVQYLIAALDLDTRESTIFEMGGADIVSYEGIMTEYARVHGLKRRIVPLPFLTPWLSSLWLALVTPLYAQIGRRLLEGVRNETTVKDRRAAKVFKIKPMGIRETIERALANKDREFAETRWSDALPERSLEQHWGGIRFGSRLLDTREAKLPCAPSLVFTQIQCIGGGYGWHRYNWLLNLRGFIDQLMGGVGHRRGRRDSKCLLPGDTVDFCRVEALEPNRLLRLHSELRAPRRAWFQYEITGTDKESTLRQTAIFDPIGLAGLLYSYGPYPLHVLDFTGTLNGIVDSILNKASQLGGEQLRFPPSDARLNSIEAPCLPFSGGV
jgi:uncharacterized protein YbjT (DUF2867 family)